MKVLLIGEKYSTNLGDGVIFDTVKEILKRQYGCDIINLDISGHSNYNLNNQENKSKISFLKKMINKNKVLKRKLSLLKRKIFITKEIKKIDLSKINYAIFCGGQMFMEYFLQPMDIITKELEKHNIPTIFNCCGLGKTTSTGDTILNKILTRKNVIKISIRDNMEKFQKKYKAKNVELVLDPVMEVKEYNSYKLNYTNRPKIGIGLMDFKLYEHNNIGLELCDYEELVLKIIEKIENKKLEWEFFCNGAIEDYKFIEEICKKFNLKNKIAPRPKLPEELVNTIIQYNKIISFRLHSHIIATSFSIPTIGFVWDNKVRDFSKNINREDFFIDLNKESVKKFEKISERFFSNDNQIKIKDICKYDSEFIQGLELKNE